MLLTKNLEDHLFDDSCVFIDGKLCLHAAKWRKPFWVDFTKFKSRIGLKRELLLRAVGAKPGLKVIDATAGFGRDAFLLASVACKVVMLERDPKVHALLADGLKRAEEEPELAAIVANMEVLVQNFDSLNSNLFAMDTPDVVYLDPMFPLVTKAAAVKKYSQALRLLCAPAVKEVQDLVALALKVAKKRVVLKQHVKNNISGLPKPSWRLQGKSVIFDIYSCS